MNPLNTCFAIALALAFGPAGARAESTAFAVAANPAGVSSAAEVAVAGLGTASIQAMPAFPAKAHRAGYRQGRVVLGYTANADGTIGNIEVLEASPVQVFTRTATNTLAGWRFAPTGASEQRQVEFRFIAE